MEIELAIKINQPTKNSLLLHCCSYSLSIRLVCMTVRRPFGFTKTLKYLSLMKGSSKAVMEY
jgi:hypothetical protein